MRVYIYSQGLRFRGGGVISSIKCFKIKVYNLRYCVLGMPLLNFSLDFFWPFYSAMVDKSFIGIQEKLFLKCPLLMYCVYVCVYAWLGCDGTLGNS